MNINLDCHKYYYKLILHLAYFPDDYLEIGENMQKKLTWVLAHEPYDLFIKAAKNFQNEVSSETNGRYQIDVISLSEYNERSGNILTNHASDRERVVKLVNDGKIDMATVYVNTLGQINNQMYALSMPFLFDNHDHAERVLDGKIGLDLLAGMSKVSQVKGLAFTYSGGYRIIPSKNAIENLKDFYNLKIRCSKSPVAQDTFKTLGSTPVSMLIDDFAKAFDNNEVDAGETTYPRFYALGHNKSANVINHTEHSLFLTSIVTNTKLWSSMDEQTQKVFANAALSAAKIERQESLKDIEKVQAQAKEDGIETVVMKNAEKEKFMKTTQPLYNKYNSVFGNGLLDSIKSA